jgi:hypothetical protein
MMPLRRKRSSRAPALTLAGASLAVSGAIAALVLWRRRRASQPVDSRMSWACECGQRYLVQGTDRHRVYWLPDAALSDPLLDRECVQCGTALPAGHEAVSAHA